MNPYVPAAGHCWLLALMPDVLHLMSWDRLNTDSYLALGIMEGKGGEHMSYALNIQSLLRAPTRCLQARQTLGVYILI